MPITVTRTNNFNTKKLLSQMCITIDESTRNDLIGDPSFQYLVGYLPADCFIQNAYVATRVAQGVADVMDVGTTNGGNDILQGGPLNAVGFGGTFNGPVDTGTGVPVYITMTVDPTVAVFTLVIEYLEFKVSTGSLTHF